MTGRAQQLQALLLVAGEAVSRAELTRLLGAAPEELQILIAEVQSALAGQGITIIETAQAVELTTSPEVGAWLGAYIKQGDEDELTRAAAETLAIVAYCGPLRRHEVDMLRGVDSRRVLRQLRERGVVARDTVRGQAPRYDITEDFLKHLGLARREQLPRFEELSRHENVQQLLHRHL